MAGRLLLLGLAAGGFLLWKGAFGVVATEREVAWRVPGAFATIRKLELQLYQGEQLLSRHELLTPAGLAADPTQRLLLAEGDYQARMLVWREGEPAPAATQARVHVGESPAVVVQVDPR